MDTLRKEDLTQFTGTDRWYRHQLNRRVLFTDGVQYLAEAGQAYWLIDAIASYLVPSDLVELARKDSRIESMQFWELRVADDNSAVLEGKADSPAEPFVKLSKKSPSPTSRLIRSLSGPRSMGRTGCSIYQVNIDTFQRG